MNTKNIFLLLILLFIVNVYAALTVEEEEEEDYYSHDKFDELLMTVTAPSKTLPTITATKASKTLPTITSTSTIPVQTSVSIFENEEGVPMKEITYTYVDYPYFFRTSSTVIPADVDDLHVSCDLFNQYYPYTEPHPPRYFCNVDKTCYTFRNNYNITDPYGASYNCNFFTRRNNDPVPTDTENMIITSICKPVLQTSTSRKTYYVFSTSSTITDKTKTDLDTLYYSIVKSISTTEIPVSTITICSKSETVKPKPTIINEPKPYNRYFTDDVINDRKVIFTKNYNMESMRYVTVILPEEVEDYAIDCNYSIKYPPKGMNYRRDFPATKVTSVSKTLPMTTSNNNNNSNSNSSSSSRSSNRSGSAKTIPKIVSSSTTNNSSSTIKNSKYISTYIQGSSKTVSNSFYCQRDDYCFSIYTRIYNIKQDGMYTTNMSCFIYTHTKGEATRTTPCTNCNTSYCRPTQTLRDKEVTDYVLDYGTTITDGDYVTTKEYRIRSYYTTKSAVEFCKSEDDIPTSISSSSSTPTPTPTPIPTTLPSKCPPVIVTVTENDTTTITEKETITVTISTKDEEPDDSKCAKKWAQCGGQGFNGPTCCQSGSTCHKYNQHYSQCI